MEEWKEYRLGDVAIIKGGKRLPKGIELISNPNAHPYIRISDMYVNKTMELTSSYRYVDNNTFNKIKNYIVNSGDVILAIVGNTIGLVAVVGKSLNNANLTENCVKIIANKEVSQEYIYYYLTSIYGQNKIKKGIVGAAQPKLPIKNIISITISAPSKELQERTTNILSSLDDKIELNRRINENLEQQAQALFKSWFVDFEPFKDGKFVDSELGMIPEGWKVTTLGKVTTQITERVKTRINIKVLSPINTGELVLSEEYFTKQVFSTNIEKYYIVKPMQFAYNPARINIGSIGMNTYNFNGCVSPVYVVFECENDYQYFFDYFRKTKKFKEEVISRAIGGVRQSLTYKDFSLIKIIYPPKHIIDSFNKIYSSLLKLKRFTQEENCKLVHLRDTLLPKLMSGELKLSEMETKLDE